MIGIAMSLLKLMEARDVLAVSRLPAHVLAVLRLEMEDRAGVLWRQAAWIIAGCALLVLSLAYAVIKIVIAHVCESSL